MTWRVSSLARRPWPSLCQVAQACRHAQIVRACPWTRLRDGRWQRGVGGGRCAGILGGGGGSVGRGPRLSEARRLDESCRSESDMYAEPLWRRGFEIRSACPRLLVPPWFDGRMGGATREFKSCRLQVGNSALTRSVTRHAEPPAPEAPSTVSRFSFFGFFQKNGDVAG